MISTVIECLTETETDTVTGTLKFSLQYVICGFVEKYLLHIFYCPVLCW